MITLSDPDGTNGSKNGGRVGSSIIAAGAAISGGDVGIVVSDMVGNFVFEIITSDGINGIKNGGNDVTSTVGENDGTLLVLGTSVTISLGTSLVISDGTNVALGTGDDTSSANATTSDVGTTTGATMGATTGGSMAVRRSLLVLLRESSLFLLLFTTIIETPTIAPINIVIKTIIPIGSFMVITFRPVQIRL